MSVCASFTTFTEYKRGATALLVTVETPAATRRIQISRCSLLTMLGCFIGLPSSIPPPLRLYHDRIVGKLNMATLEKREVVLCEIQIPFVLYSKRLLL